MEDFLGHDRVTKLRREELVSTQAAIVVQHSFTFPRFVLRDEGREGLVSTAVAT